LVTVIAFNPMVKKGKERKGKEEYLYSAFIQRLVSKCSDMDHTVYLQITPRLVILELLIIPELKLYYALLT